MALIYGMVPRTLKGSWKYANAAYVDETLAVGESTTPSYFDVAKTIEETTTITPLIVAPAGDYQVDIEVSVDDGVTFKKAGSITQDLPARLFRYESPNVKVRATVVAATGPVRCILRQD